MKIEPIPVAVEPTQLTPNSPQSAPSRRTEQRQVETAVATINASGALRSSEITFSRPTDSDRMVIQVVDRDTGEIIQQIPAEQVLRLAEAIKRSGGGTFF
ncbi:MAG: flagellar protein FlaG [Bryobacterales bacterium]|nr:flagellar protein FlaG [Bryobacterales bacterium]